MMNKTGRSAMMLLCVTYILCFLGQSSYSVAETLTSPFNGRRLTCSDVDGNFSFLVGGHLYGAPQNQSSVYPSSSLLGGLDIINDIGAEFFMGLGDIIWRSYDVEMPLFRRAFALKLKSPLFNSVGNHDMVFRKRYEAELGPTYFEFVCAQSKFIVLDSELYPGGVSGEQLNFFFQSLLESKDRRDLKNIFIFSHRLIWLIGKESYGVVFDHINNKDGYIENNNYRTEILPELRKVTKDKKIYWISGDIGCSWSLPLFFQSDASDGVTYVATGIGDTEKDLVLQFVIDGQGAVSVKSVSLAAMVWGDPENYGIDYWEEYYGIGE